MCCEPVIAALTGVLLACLSTSDSVDLKNLIHTTIAWLRQPLVKKKLHTSVVCCISCMLPLQRMFLHDVRASLGSLLLDNIRYQDSLKVPLIIAHEVPSADVTFINSAELKLTQTSSRSASYTLFKYNLQTFACAWDHSCNAYIQ